MYTKKLYVHEIATGIYFNMAFIALIGHLLHSKLKLNIFIISEE